MVQDPFFTKIQGLQLFLKRVGAIQNGTPDDDKAHGGIEDNLGIHTIRTLTGVAQRVVHKRKDQNQWFDLIFRGNTALAK